LAAADVARAVVGGACGTRWHTTTTTTTTVTASDPELVPAPVPPVAVRVDQLQSVFTRREGETFRVLLVVAVQELAVVVHSPATDATVGAVRSWAVAGDPPRHLAAPRRCLDVHLQLHFGGGRRGSWRGGGCWVGRGGSGAIISRGAEEQVRRAALRVRDGVGSSCGEESARDFYDSITGRSGGGCGRWRRCWYWCVVVPVIIVVIITAAVVVIITTITIIIKFIVIIR